MNTELKKAIVNYMFDNAKEFQLVNATTEKFRQYIFTPDGDWCFGGQKVSEFIKMTEKIVKY